MGYLNGYDLSVKGFLSTMYNDLDTDAASDNGDASELRIQEMEIDFNIQRDNLSGTIALQSMGSSDIELEQAYAMYNITESFAISAGKMANITGFESSEAPKMYQDSRAFFLGNLHGHYNNGIRAGYTSETWEAFATVYDKLWTKSTRSNSDLDMAYELSLAVSPIQGLTLSIEYAEDDNSDASSMPYRSTYIVDQFAGNAAISSIVENGLSGYAVSSAFDFWITYQIASMLFGFEYSDFEFGNGDKGDSWLLLANLAFSGRGAITLRYSEEEINGSSTVESDLMTLSPSYAFTDNLLALLEYSRGTAFSVIDFDYFAMKGIFTF